MSEQELHGGVIHLADSLIREMFADVFTIDATDTQGVLRDKGVFTEVQKRLLLPESYQVHYIFYEWMLRQWSIIVESPDLPLAIEGQELPRLTPWYQSNEDGSTQLVRIES